MKKQRDNKQDEVMIVALAYAGVEPFAVMVEISDTSIALSTMFTVGVDCRPAY